MTSFHLARALVALAVPVLASALSGAETGRAALQAAVDRVYDLRTLHRIEITIAPPDTAKLLEHSDVRISCTFTFDGVTLRNVGVRQAGGPAHPYVSIEEKPSLSLKFSEFVKGQNLHGLERMVLKNELQDVTLVNEHLTYEVFRRAGLAAPTTAYAVVTLNGLQSGIYLMREPVNKDFLIRTLGRGQELGNLYETDYFAGDFAAIPQAIELKDEKEDGRSRADLVALAATGSTVPPEYFTRAVSPLLDLDQYLTFFALEALTAHGDGFNFHNNNSYLYRRPADGRFILIPHGADEGFGGTNSTIVRISSPYQGPWGALPRRTLQVPELRAKFRAEVERLGRPPVWDAAALLARVDAIGRILETAPRTGRAARDVALFLTNRAHIERFIKAGGTQNLALPE
jgi:spore coat protein H